MDAIIRAEILQRDGKILVDSSGRLPELPHQPGETWERTLARLGEAVLCGTHLCIQERVYPNPEDGIIQYRAHPYAGDVEPTDGYRWDTSETLTDLA
jgi:hypothetical protein